MNQCQIRSFLLRPDVILVIIMAAMIAARWLGWIGW
jgi:hypothetical protein